MKIWINKNDNEECIEFKKIRHIENKISINELKDINGLQNLEVLKNNHVKIFGLGVFIMTFLS